MMWNNTNILHANYLLIVVAGLQIKFVEFYFILCFKITYYAIKFAEILYNGENFKVSEY